MASKTTDYGQGVSVTEDTNDPQPAGAAAPAGSGAAAGEAYPQFSWLYSDPELGPVLRQATDEGWSDTRLEGAMQQTNWWRTHAAASRNYLQLAATDPAEATRRINNYDSMQKYITDAASFGMKVSLQTAADQIDRVVRGEIGPDALMQELRMQAKNLFPYLAKQIDDGGTVASTFEPYRQRAVEILGINPAAIQPYDSKWQQLLTVTDDKGNKRLSTMDEAEHVIRTDGRFGFNASQQGRNFYNDAAQVIGKAFGSVA